MECPLSQKKESTENTDIDNMDKLQEKTDESDTVKDQCDIAKFVIKNERKAIKKEDNGPGLENKSTDIRNDMENCNNVNNDTTPDITHSNAVKAVAASDDMKPALEQNATELLHSIL